jgi:predicted nucleic acid-binding protein
MITAIDSNILIDVIGSPSRFTDPAIHALDEARQQGALIISPIVVAEIAGHFSSASQQEKCLREMGLRLIDFSMEDSYHAGQAYIAYKSRSKDPKPRMLADFMVGAHASLQADQLMTRDRGYYRTYFPKLKIVEPTRSV